MTSSSHGEPTVPPGRGSRYGHRSRSAGTIVARPRAGSGGEGLQGLVGVQVHARLGGDDVADHTVLTDDERGALHRGEAAEESAALHAVHLGDLAALVREQRVVEAVLGREVLLLVHV